MDPPRMASASKMDPDAPMASSDHLPSSENPGSLRQQHPPHLPGVGSQPTLSTDVSDLTPRPSPRSGILRRNCPRPPPINIPSVEDDIEDDEKTEVPPTSPESPGLPTPLLAGCPGREISGAKSDGREWAYDWDSPPVLLYPDDLSKTEFHEHPLARHIELENGFEQGQLAMYGLILPATIDNGTPTYTWESDDEEEEDRTKTVVLAKTPRRASRPPPLRTPAPAPAINTERQRTPSKVLQKVKTFANFVTNGDMEKEVPELPTLKELLDQFGMPPGTPAESAPRTFLRPTKSSNSLRPKTPTKLPSATKLRNKRSATGIAKILISDPVAPEEMKRVGKEFSEASTRSHRPRTKTASESDRISNYAASLRSPSNLISPSISSNMPLYLLQPAHPSVFNGTNEPPPKFRLARPRLAPMEYARQYLLAKAKADEQGEECTVQKPDTTRCWTEHYKEFLLIPSIPKGVTRNFLPDVEETDPEWIKKKKPVAATKDMDEEAAKRRSFQPLPLNLAPSSPLLPAHLRTSSLASTASSNDKRDSSLDAFTLDLPRAASSDHCLLQSTKALITNPTASIPRANTDVFVAVNTSSEREYRSSFTSSFPPQFLSSTSLGRDRPSRQYQHPPLLASERDSSAAPPERVFTATLADHQPVHQPVHGQQLTPRSATLNDVPHDFPFARPPSVAALRRAVSPAVFTPLSTQDVPATSPDQDSFDEDDTRSEVTAVYRPGSALSSCTVIGPCSPVSSAADPDKNEISPNSINYDESNLPPAPVSPLSSSPATPQMGTFAPLQDTRTHDTWDDALTWRSSDETVQQSIADEGVDCIDFADTSSVYSQDSVLTAIHHPAAGRHLTPLDFMPQSESAVEQEEDPTPQQLREPSSAEAQAQPGTLENSTTILRPVSYVPNTEVAQTYTASEASQEYQNDRRSQASTLTIDSSYTHRMPSQDGRPSRTYESRMEADLRRMRAEERKNMGRASFTNTDGRQYEDNQRVKPRGTRTSHAGNSQDAASIASVASSFTSQHDRYSTFSDAASASTSESRRSQALSFTSVASSDRSTASKPRRSRIDTPHDAAAPFRDPRLPALDPVIESPSQSPGLRISATSPAINSAGRPRKSSLPSRRDSAQQGTDSELPSLKVRRRRPVADLDPLPASQAYPQPLRFSSLKSPPPGAVPGQPSTNITRSSSRLITDIGKELDREMKDVLSPHTAELVAQEDSLEESNVETPTRRPPRQVRSMRSLPRFDAPSMPAPSKPLPSIPQPKTRSEAPSRPQTSGPAFVDVDFGPGPVVSRAHPPLPPIPPPRVASVPRPPIPTVTPLVSPTIPPSPSTGSVHVTHNDFSVKKDRTIRPAASVAAFGYRPSEYSMNTPRTMRANNDTAPTVDPMPARQVRRLESTANLQPPPVPPAPPAPTSARTRILGKMASMAELKHRREVASSASGGSSEEAVGMRTFLGEDAAPAAAPSKTENSKKKFFGGLFRRKKDGEK
ncbi:hypothetical protein CcaCcLH18_06742 [Colletotrichum camelliae]|nr:hypothetical protein CcaCcLH18_06742 [Colletotrichum camelliae]